MQTTRKLTTRLIGATTVAATAATLAGAAGLAVGAAPAQAAGHQHGQRQERQQYAYAELLAPGWSAEPGDSTADGSVTYVDGADRATLAWHPAGTDRAPYRIGERSGTTTMDGDRAPVFDYQSIPTALGPTVNGQFLTLSSTTLDDGQLGDLAGQVHRTAYATLEQAHWVAGAGNQPGDDKLAYSGPHDATVSLNWRPAADYGPKYAEGKRVATTRLDGDRARVLRDGNSYVVVAKPREGRFLTLTGAGLGKHVIARLARSVQRR